MTDWAQEFASTDEAVDRELGDEFLFAADGNSFVAIKGFAFPPGSEAEIDYAPIDRLSGQPRLKVRKKVIAVPSKAHRFLVPQFGEPMARWRPENWITIDAGRYWLIDMQKAAL